MDARQVKEAGIEPLIWSKRQKENILSQMKKILEVNSKEG